MFYGENIPPNIPDDHYTTPKSFASVKPKSSQFTSIRPSPHSGPSPTSNRFRQSRDSASGYFVEPEPFAENSISPADDGADVAQAFRAQVLAACAESSGIDPGSLSFHNDQHFLPVEVPFVVPAEYTQPMGFNHNSTISLTEEHESEAVDVGESFRQQVLAACTRVALESWLDDATPDRTWTPLETRAISPSVLNQEVNKLLSRVPSPALMREPVPDEAPIFVPTLAVEEPVMRPADIPPVPLIVETIVTSPKQGLRRAESEIITEPLSPVRDSIRLIESYDKLRRPVSPLTGSNRPISPTSGVVPGSIRSFKTLPRHTESSLEVESGTGESAIEDIAADSKEPPRPTGSSVETGSVTEEIGSDNKQPPRQTDSSVEAGSRTEEIESENRELPRQTDSSVEAGSVESVVEDIGGQLSEEEAPLIAEGYSVLPEVEKRHSLVIDQLKLHLSSRKRREEEEEQPNEPQGISSHENSSLTDLIQALNFGHEDYEAIDDPQIMEEPEMRNQEPSTSVPMGDQQGSIKNAHPSLNSLNSESQPPPSLHPITSELDPPLPIRAPKLETPIKRKGGLFNCCCRV